MEIIEYQYCKNCGADTFYVYRIKGELGTIEECECGNLEVAFKEE